VEQTFAAGHALRNYKGKCENVHGHNYRVRVTIAGEQLDATGLLVDFLDVKRVMGAAIDYLDHRFINDLAPFDEINPSAENIAKYFYDRMNDGLKNEVPVRISEIRVWETDTSSAVYRP
jgi:6-pyruvoyltetrahydropterin/6-carboxytetrahydropterin synthase